MAQNYTIFSEYLTYTSEEQRVWLDEYMGAICDEGYPDGVDKDPWPEAKAHYDEHCGLGFDAEWRNGCLWIYTEESGDVDAVGAFVHEFLKKFHKDSYWTMTWACTCSKPRVGEFSGGGIVVHAEGVEFMNPWKFFESVKKRLISKTALIRREDAEEKEESASEEEGLQEGQE
jgi:hypothetical protein